MDCQKFGAFIAALRKEKGWTQRELADQLHVTDKAISKWERGLGFPDIKMIEPLADALEVSVLELMRSERIQENHIPANRASEALGNVIGMAAYQQKIERRNIAIILVSIAAFVLMAFLIDEMELLGFIMVCLPVILFLTGAFLLIVSFKKYKQQSSFSTTLILGILSISFPLLLFILLSFAFMLGGPVPN